MFTMVRSRPWRMLALLTVSGVALLVSALGQHPGASANGLCTPGFFSATGSPPCEACPVGKFSATAGATVCTNCPVGTFNASTGASACTSCAPGTFNASVGATACQLCGQGTFSASTAATACENCDPGTFNASLGATACQLCGQGTFSASTGATACADCAVGTFGATSGASACASCPAGQYTFTAGSTNCDADCGLWTGARSVKLTKVNTDPVPGNDGLKVMAEFTLPVGFASLDLAATGARVILQGAGQDLVLDATLPAGAYGGAGTRGWELRRKGREWRYTDDTGVPIDGIASLSIEDRNHVDAGVARVSIAGKDGDYPVGPGDSPLRAVIALDDTGGPVCSDSDFTADDCAFNGAQSTLICKKKGS